MTTLKTPLTDEAIDAIMKSYKPAVCKRTGLTLEQCFCKDCADDYEVNSLAYCPMR
jgi:hypothetical protein